MIGPEIDALYLFIPAASGSISIFVSASNGGVPISASYSLGDSGPQHHCQGGIFSYICWSEIPLDLQG
jgi:hypothetical protein